MECWGLGAVVQVQVQQKSVPEQQAAGGGLPRGDSRRGSSGGGHWRQERALGWRRLPGRPGQEPVDIGLVQNDGRPSGRGSV